VGKPEAGPAEPRQDFSVPEVLSSPTTVVSRARTQVRMSAGIRGRVRVRWCSQIASSASDSAVRPRSWRRRIRRSGHGFGGEFTYLALRDLSSGRAGQVIEDQQMLGKKFLGDATIGEMPGELGESELMAGPEVDDRADPFAEYRVRHGDHTGQI